LSHFTTGDTTKVDHVEKQRMVKDGDSNTIQDSISCTISSDSLSIHSDPNSPFFHHNVPPNIVKRSSSVPPALLLPTSSKNIFVAKIYCQRQDISHHHQLFLNFRNRKIIFRTNGVGYFEYFPKATYELSASSTQPEVAFLGRSNVGKSSLINSLMRQSLAITSKHPGRTKKAYYYGYINSNPSRVVGKSDTYRENNNKQDLQNTASGFIIDLPGYGYATSPQHIVSEWQKQVQDFLLMRRDTNHLKRLFLLQDARTGALPIDFTVQNWLNEALIPYTIVFTKMDCVGPSSLIKHINLACMRYHHQFSDIENYHNIFRNRQNETLDEGQSRPSLGQGHHSGLRLCMSPFIYATSSKSNNGIDELLHAIEDEFLS
jgi:GTP-binding protein EngB required for normal cell division